jgi:hypothetical protein
MYPYFLMIGMPALLAMVAGRRFQSGFALIAVFALFVGVIGLRYDIGPDWFAYSTHFNRFGSMNLIELVAEGEIGWSLLVRLVDALGLGMLGLTMFAAIVFCIGVFAVARVCQEPMLAVVAAVPYLSIAVAMSGMRQAVAIGIVFFLLSRWYRSPMLFKIVMVLIASTFHFSALAMLAIIALEARLPLYQKVAAGTIITAILVFFIGGAEQQVEGYATTYLPGGAAADAPGAIYHVLLTAAPSIAYFVMRRRWIALYGRIPVIDLFAAIGIVALGLVFFFPTATDRMTLYFAAVALIIQGNFPQLWRGRNEQAVVRFAIVALNVAAMVTFLVAGNKAKAFVPYASIFSESAEFGLPRR